MSRRGLSLPEALVSLFFLLGLFLLVTQLFHTGLRYHRWAESRAVAAILLNDKMEEIRNWSSRPVGGGYNFDDWSSYDGVTTAHPVHSGYRLETTVFDQVLYSPSSGFEQVELDQRRLSASLKKVQIDVVWDDNRGESRITGILLVSDPTRDWGTPALVLNPAAPTPVSPGGTTDFSVQAFDSDGLPVPDAFFEWIVLAGTGNGTVVPLDRSGRTARLHNGVYSEQTTTYVPVPGDCRVGVRAVLWGREETVLSAPIELLP